MKLSLKKRGEARPQHRLAPLFSSKKTEWETPPEFFQRFHEEFAFTLDACASAHNKKLPYYIAKKDNALEADWADLSEGGNVWMNPPYGRGLWRWVLKAYEESEKGINVVCLIPARVDTRYFHDYCILGENRLVRGRLKFLYKGKQVGTATFPSLVTIFGPRAKKGSIIVIDRE